jgi:hypothetical protein
MLQTVLGIIAALGVAALLARQLLDAMATARRRPAEIFDPVLPLFDSHDISAGDTVGCAKLIGRHRGELFQLQTVVDTLATRKLPSLWLLVTLPQPQPVGGVFDMMMRPAGPSTFSNFDFLPQTIATPQGFPEQAVIRTDGGTPLPPADVIRPHLRVFHTAAGKELLISPKGLRIVVLAAEADRARYGVFREANFGAVRLEARALAEVLDTLIALAQDIAKEKSSSG